MYCPQCGQERISHVTSFCSRCGYLLTGTAELLQIGGLIPRSTTNSKSSPRTRGLKQGLFIFLLTFLVVPIMAMLMVWLHTTPFALVVSAIALSVGGLLRMVYALLFESKASGGQTLEEEVLTGPQGLAGRPNLKVLPPLQSVPVSSYGPPQPGHWRDTKDLQIDNVTEGATRELVKHDQ